MNFHRPSLYGYHFNQLVLIVYLQRLNVAVTMARAIDEDIKLLKLIDGTQKELFSNHAHRIRSYTFIYKPNRGTSIKIERNGKTTLISFTD